MTTRRDSALMPWLAHPSASRHSGPLWLLFHGWPHYSSSAPKSEWSPYRDWGAYFGCINSSWILYPAVFALVVGNTINAAADIGAIAAAMNLLVIVPAKVIVVLVSLLILAIQIWGSYRRIAGFFKWLTLSLLAYVGSAYFAHPEWG